MSPLRALGITVLAFAAHSLLLPSCVQWNIGENIREAAETHVGIFPMDAWLMGEESKELKPLILFMEQAQVGDRRDGRVCIAREARYEADTPLVGGFFPPDAVAQNITLTEHYRRVDFRLNKLCGLTSIVGDRYDPAGQKREPHEGKVHRYGHLDARSMGSAEVERSAWYPLAVAIAAPFDYIIDPALSVASAPVVVGVMAGMFAWDSVKRSAEDIFASPEPAPAPPTPADS